MFSIVWLEVDCMEQKKKVLKVKKQTVFQQSIRIDSHLEREKYQILVVFFSKIYIGSEFIIQKDLLESQITLVNPSLSLYGFN